jgi:di/tricarboxylate transporter
VHRNSRDFFLVSRVENSSPPQYERAATALGGGYRFTDYLRVGVPLDLLVWIVTVALAPLVWPF